MKNPLLDRLEKRQHGSRAEKKASKRMGARQTLASGALEWDKGDYEVADMLLDSKATIHRSVSLKLDWLEKIRKEAQGKKMVGGIHIQFTNPDGEPVPNGSWIVLPESFVQRLLNED